MKTNSNLYTPGPWYAVEYAGHVSIQSTDFYENTDILDMDSNDSVEANAKLICAAPELLSVLQKIVEMNRQQAIDQYGEADKAESWACVTIARSAINKALLT